LTIKNTRIVITISHNGVDKGLAGNCSTVEYCTYAKQLLMVSLQRRKVMAKKAKKKTAKKTVKKAKKKTAKKKR